MSAGIGLEQFLADVGGWGHMNGWGWGMAVFGIVLMAALVALIMWVVVSPSRGVSTSGVGARAILDQRYARGEIGRDEYLERKADLEV